MLMNLPAGRQVRASASKSRTFYAMAKKKASGSTRQHTTRPGKRLGIKIYGGQKIKNGNIIVRQRGSVYHPGEGVKIGRDFTLYAIKDGQVEFKKKMGKRIVSVI